VDADEEPDWGDEDLLPPISSSPVRRARERHGIAGAVLAGAMVAIRDVLDPPKDPQAVTVEASSEPDDIDKDGVAVPLDDERLAVAPPLAPLPSEQARRPRARSRSRRR
jgi:hypothetical protein